MIVQIHIPEFKGSECENQITQKLLRCKGVDHLSFNEINKTARVIYDKNRSSLEEVLNALKDLGYLAEVI